MLLFLLSFVSHIPIISGKILHEHISSSRSDLFLLRLLMLICKKVKLLSLQHPFSFDSRLSVEIYWVLKTVGSILTSKSNFLFKLLLFIKKKLSVINFTKWKNIFIKNIRKRVKKFFKFRIIN